MIRHIRNIQRRRLIPSWEEAYVIRTTGSMHEQSYYLLYLGDDYAMPIFWKTPEGEIKTNHHDYSYHEYEIERFIQVTYAEIIKIHSGGRTVHTNNVPDIVKEYLEELHSDPKQVLRVDKVVHQGGESDTQDTKEPT